MALAVIATLGLHDAGRHGHEHAASEEGPNGVAKNTCNTHPGQLRLLCDGVPREKVGVGPEPMTFSYDSGGGLVFHL